MRQATQHEIEAGLARVRRSNEANADWHAAHATGNPRDVEVAYVHTPEAKRGLQQMYANMKAFNQCAAAHAAVQRTIYSATSIGVHWSESLTSDQCVVELSQWTTLALVYIYGEPPAGLTQHIESCLQRLQLLQLTDDEVDELYERDLYATLF